MALPISKIYVIGQQIAHMCFKHSIKTTKNDRVMWISCQRCDWTLFFQWWKYHVMVNGVRCRAMLEDYWPELYRLDVNNKWFQQDDATCHTASQTIDLLKRNFRNRVISRNGTIVRLLPSCDLTPLDLFLWGYVKS